MYQDLSTRNDWLVKKAVQCRFANPDERKSETPFRYLVESVGSQNTNLGAASQTLLTDVKLRLRCRLLGPLASLYALGHYFQVGLEGRAQALFYIYDQTDALYDQLSGRKTLTLPLL